MYTAAKAGQPMLGATSDTEIAKALLSGAFSNISNPTHCLQESMATLRSAHLKRRLDELQKQADEASRRGNSELAGELAREIFATIKKQVD